MCVNSAPPAAGAGGVRARAPVPRGSTAAKEAFQTGYELVQADSTIFFSG